MLTGTREGWRALSFGTALLLLDVVTAGSGVGACGDFWKGSQAFRRSTDFGEGHAGANGQRKNSERARAGANGTSATFP